MIGKDETQPQTISSSDDVGITIYAARWVLSEATHAVERAALAVRDTQIIAVASRDELARRFPCAVVRDYGDAVIAPGFVNSHSHLELTALRNFLEAEEHDFFLWLRKLTQTKYERLTPDDMRDAAMWGAIEAVRAGVTCVGDASDFGAMSLAALKEIGLRGIVYQEVFGPDGRDAAEQLAKLKNKIAVLRESATPLMRVGVSPHAPYTVSARLLELVAGYALSEDLPLMIHAAESRAETQLLRKGSGAFAESYRRRGIPWRAPVCSPIEHLERCGVLATRPLLAHCIQVDERDIEILVRHRVGVAHCPKSNLKLGHGRAPFARFVGSGIATGLGSDSVASNNTCDMLEEARFALLLARLDTEDQNPATKISIADALDALTSGGAHALGLGDRIGILAAGREADFAVIRLDGAHQTPMHDLAAAILFNSSGRDAIATVIAGREVYRDNHITTVDEERLRARMIEIERKLANQSS